MARVFDRMENQRRRSFRRHLALLVAISIPGPAGGSVTHWNAFVANLEMHGKGTFFDPRLDDSEQFPVAARNGFGNVRNKPDLITPKLSALHFYQLTISGAVSAGRKLQSNRSGAWQGGIQQQGPLRDLPCPAAVYRAGNGTYMQAMRSKSTTSGQTGRLTTNTGPRP
jgi:hypothetical protein